LKHKVLKNYVITHDEGFCFFSPLPLLWERVGRGHFLVFCPRKKAEKLKIALSLPSPKKMREEKKGIKKYRLR
jgi:hypothetical protein